MKKETEYKPHPNYKLAFEDNFVGKQLNENYWNYREGVRLGGKNKKENVKVDSMVTIKFDHENVKKEVKYTGGGIFSKCLFGYGYYETKGKLFGKTGGLHSSFWSMGTNDGDGQTLPKNNIVIEIDGYEVDSGRPKSIGTNVHYYIGAHKTVGGVVGTLDYETIDTSKEAFVFGYEWLPNQINWYLNGKLIRSLKNPEFYGPQNVWLTALGCDFFDTTINKDLLPGYSSWDYFRYYTIDLPGINLVVNPSFEYNFQSDFEKAYQLDPSVPVGWYTSGSDLEASCVYQTEEAYEGTCVLRHHHQFDYKVTTWLKIPYIAAGIYHFKAMVRTFKDDEHWIKIYGFGEEDRTIPIKRSEEGIWQEVIIDNIKVTSSECYIAFVSCANGGSTLLVDDVSFSQNKKHKPHTRLERFEENVRKPFLPLGECIIHPSINDSGYNEFGDGWNSSGLSGVLKSSRYAPCNTYNYVIYKPQNIKTGMYEVSFFNVCYENRAKVAKVKLYHTHGCYEKELSQQGISELINLGSYEIDDSSYLEFASIEGETIGFLATESVIFETNQTKKLRQLMTKSILFKLENNKVLSEGLYKKIDPKDYRIKITLINGIVMVPLKNTAILFGAVTINEDEVTQRFDIFYADYMIRFTLNSDVVNIKTKDMKMQHQCMQVNSIVYVPLDMLAKGFEKRVYAIGKQYFLVTGEKVVLDTDISVIENLNLL